MNMYILKVLIMVVGKWVYCNYLFDCILKVFFESIMFIKICNNYSCLEGYKVFMYLGLFIKII